MIVIPPTTAAPAGSLPTSTTPDQVLTVRSDGTTAWTDAFMVNVKAWGAVGGGGVDDTAAINAATAHAATLNAGGGAGVFFPPGTYRCTGQLNYYLGCSWFGAGRSATQIFLATDLWSATASGAHGNQNGNNPAYFIVPSTGGDFGTQLGYWTLRDMSIRGPSTRNTVGLTPCRTTGIYLNSVGTVHNATVTGFFAGVACIGNHQKITDTYVTANYYGLDWAEPGTSPSFGNQVIDSVDPAGNYLAGIHVSGGNTIDTCILRHIHTGFGPVGLLKTDAPDGWDANQNPTYTGTIPSTQACITGGIIEGLYNENIGNAAIIDMSTGTSNLTLGNVSYRECGFSWDPAHVNQNGGAGLTLGTTLAPLNNTLYQQAFAVVARGISGLDFDGMESTFVPSINTFGTSVNAIGAWKFTGGGATLRYPIGANLVQVLGDGTSASPHPTAQEATKFIINNSLPNAEGEGYVYTAVGTINLGDLCEAVGSWGAQRATGTKPILGVALTSATNGGVLAVQTMKSGSLAQVNYVNTTQATTATLLSCNATTHYLADIAANNTGQPTIGFPTVNGPGAGAQTLLSGIMIQV